MAKLALRRTDAPTAVPTAAPARAPQVPLRISVPGAAEAAADMKGTAAVASASVGAAVAVGAAPVAAGPVAKLSALMALDCAIEDVDYKGAEPLDADIHPLGLPVGGHAHRYFVGAVVFNTALVAACAALMVFICGVYATCMHTTLDAAFSKFRFPGLVLACPLLYLYQGFSLSAAHLSFGPGAFGKRAPWQACAFGWAALCGAALTPVTLWRRVFRNGRFWSEPVPDPRAVAAPPPPPADEDGGGSLTLVDRAAAAAGAGRTGWGRRRRRAYRVLFGDVIWVSTRGHFVERLGCIFESHRPGCRWWPLVEMVQIFLLGFFAGWEPRGSAFACHLRNALCSCVMLTHLVLLACLRPYLALGYNVINGAMSLFNFLAVLFILFAFSGVATKTLLPLSWRLLFLSAIVAVLLVSVDIFVYLMDIYLGRQRNACRAAQEHITAQHSMRRPPGTGKSDPPAPPPDALLATVDTMELPPGPAPPSSPALPVDVPGIVLRQLTTGPAAEGATAGHRRRRTSSAAPAKDLHSAQAACPLLSPAVVELVSRIDRIQSTDGVESAQQQPLKTRRRRTSQKHNHRSTPEPPADGGGEGRRNSNPAAAVQEQNSRTRRVRPAMHRIRSAAHTTRRSASHLPDSPSPGASPARTLQTGGRLSPADLGWELVEDLGKRSVSVTGQTTLSAGLRCAEKARSSGSHRRRCRASRRPPPAGAAHRDPPSNPGPQCRGSPRHSRRRSPRLAGAKARRRAARRPRA